LVLVQLVIIPFLKGLIKCIQKLGNFNGKILTVQF
jgi:hypothetical protein